MSTLDGIAYVASFAEFTLYGVSFCTFIACGFTILKYRHSFGYNLVTVALLVSLFLINTAHAGVTVQRFFVCFKSNSSTARFWKLSQPSYLAHVVVYTSQVILGDVTLLHRSFVVSNHSWNHILLPLLLWTGLLPCAIGTWISASHANGLSTSNNDPIWTWLIPFLGLTLLCDLSLHVPFISRLYRSEKSTRDMVVTPNPMRSINAVVCSIGIVYCALIVSSLVLTIQHSSARLILLNMTVPFISISACVYAIALRITFMAPLPEPSGRQSPMTFSHIHGNGQGTSDDISTIEMTEMVGGSEDFALPNDAKTKSDKISKTFA